MFEIIIIAAALVAGAVLGVTMYRKRAGEHIAAATQRASRIREESGRSVELTLREGQAQAREEVLQVERLADAEREAVGEQIERLRVRIGRNKQRVEEREQQLDDRQATIDARFKELRLQRSANKELRDEAKALRGQKRAVLEEQAGVKAEELASKIGETLIEQTRSQCADRLRNLESNAGEEPARDAKRVMGISIARYDGHCPRDRGVSTFALAAGQAEKLQNKHAGFVDQLGDELGINISIAESGDSLRMDTGDGVGREMCRRVLTRLLSEKKGKEKDPESLLPFARTEVEREIVKLGKKAFTQLGLKPAHPEIVDLVGRLNWRTSYTQNQYRHAIEAARFSGLMAGELDLDPMIAKRGTLLHDIGKALTHSVEGSHALIGAEIARRTGEHELVANAIGAHHGEEPMASAYAWLAAAADAMSGGRPGARREIVESYGDRIGDLERIASAFRGVSAVHAVQAGRELRVLVDERRVADGKLEDLSAEIADKISDELTFPGQIRVTVIREFRATATAN
jgi:ribonuclease Y